MIELPLEKTLIIAPHPDDESIAAAGLMQRALAAGAEVRVLFVTDGDNNPWPLRFLKKKLHINDIDRAEWGALRRDESLRALAALGVPSTAAIFLGYRDRALTKMARSGDLRVSDSLTAAIDDFAPSLLVLPSASDLHPDHRAIAWHARDAASGRKVIIYIVHGHRPDARLALRLELTAEEEARKRAAIECHQSQLVLSRTRFLSYARNVEEFYEADLDRSRLDSRVRDWQYAMKHAARVVLRRGCG